MPVPEKTKTFCIKQRIFFESKGQMPHLLSATIFRSALAILSYFHVIVKVKIENDEERASLLFYFYPYECTNLLECETSLDLREIKRGSKCEKVPQI